MITTFPATMPTPVHASQNTKPIASERPAHVYLTGVYGMLADLNVGQIDGGSNSSHQTGGREQRIFIDDIQPKGSDTFITLNVRQSF